MVALRLVAVALLVAVATATVYTPVTVSTALGDIEGLQVSSDEGVISHNQFLGVPFGEDTSGANRWMPRMPFVSFCMLLPSHCVGCCLFV